jgi:heme a synthase
VQRIMGYPMVVRPVRARWGAARTLFGVVKPSTSDLPSTAFRRLSLSAVLTSLVVIALGGATRATDSGLACPTWPGCFTGLDFLPPVSGEFTDGLNRTVTGLNIWLEHSHRLVAGVLALQIAVLLVWVLRSYRTVPGLLWPTVGAAVMVNIQAALGALVVWNLVRAELVTLHLGLGSATMVVLIYLAVRSRTPLRAPDDAVGRRTWRFAVISTGVLWMQILIGGHLTGVNGGLAYKFDPMLGLFSVGPITVEAEAVNVVHRYLAYLVTALIVALAVRMRRSGASRTAMRWVRISCGLVGVQILLGVTNLYSDLSYVSVIPHLLVASWILASMAMVCLSLASPATPVDRRPTPTDTPQLESIA